MDAIGKQLHMRGSVYDVIVDDQRGYMLPLIERSTARGVVARVNAYFFDADAKAWVEKHRPELKAGASLNGLDLLDLHPDKGVLGAYVVIPPTIAPPRHAAPSVHPSQATPAQLERHA